MTIQRVYQAARFPYEILKFLFIKRRVTRLLDRAVRDLYQGLDLSHLSDEELLRTLRGFRKARQKCSDDANIHGVVKSLESICLALRKEAYKRGLGAQPV